MNCKVTGRASGIPAGLALGAAASLVITLAASAISAWLILRGSLPETSVGYCAMAILLLASAAGSVTAVHRIKRLRFQMSLLSGAIYYLCLLAITAMFFGGIYEGMGVTALMVLCGSVVVILLSGGRQNRTGCRRRKKHT